MLTAPESAFIFFIVLAIVITVILLLATIHCLIECRNYQNESENGESDLFDIIDLDKLIGRYEFIEKERIKRQLSNNCLYHQDILPYEYLKDKMFEDDIYDSIRTQKTSTSTDESTLPISSSPDEDKRKILKEELRELNGNDNIGFPTDKKPPSPLERKRTWKGLDDDKLSDELKEISLPSYNDTGSQTTETLDKITAKEVLKKLLTIKKTVHPLETLV
uniref:Phosphoprotein n=1 Tax=Strongyloides papillosus TaxID=174720 RepID=A0A0N5C5W9_STREA